jgi:Putative restriction endonuclease
MKSIQTTAELSLADFLELPETKPTREYIDGQIYPKPIPKGKHSVIQTMLAPAINQVGILNRSVRAFTELRCTFGGRSLVPDISVFCWQRILLDESGEIENTFEVAPDWVVSTHFFPVRGLKQLTLPSWRTGLSACFNVFLPRKGIKTRSLLIWKGTRYNQAILSQ